MNEPRWRPEVVAFADAMEERLRANDHKRGWDSCTMGYLRQRLKGEMGELFDEIDKQQKATCRDTGAVNREAADVANFAMMIADRWGGLKPGGKIR
jgi:NTP pyrophosphatase (non-canonical NTP hydrolase)